MKRLLFIPLLLTALGVSAQDDGQLVVDAQLRTRGEYRHGALYPLYEDESAAKFINQRTRLSAQYESGGMTFRAAAQHTGVWGQDPQIDKQGRLTLNEAWARLRFLDDFFVQVGRQQLVYDDERLLGASDWDVAGRWHDALKVGYEHGAHKGHVILALNQNDEQFRQIYYDASKGQPYKSMQTFWYHFDATELLPFPAEVSLMLINLGLESGDAQRNKSDVKYMQTFGAYGQLCPLDGLVLTGSLYLQRGNRNSTRMGSAQAAYDVTPDWKVTAGYEYLSGDNNNDGINHAFNPLYGTHHKFYGTMDLFYASSLRPLAKPVGLQDFHLAVQTGMVPRMSIQADYHYFATGTHIDGSFLSLGHEVDAQVSFDVMKNVSLSAGYSFLLGTRTLDVVKGGNHKRWQDWAWLQLNINPRIFKK